VGKKKLAGFQQGGCFVGKKMPYSVLGRFQPRLPFLWCQAPPPRRRLLGFKEEVGGVEC